MGILTWENKIQVFKRASIFTLIGKHKWWIYDPIIAYSEKHINGWYNCVIYKVANEKGLFIICIHNIVYSTGSIYSPEAIFLEPWDKCLYHRSQAKHVSIQLYLWKYQVPKMKLNEYVIVLGDWWENVHAFYG